MWPLSDTKSPSYIEQQEGGRQKKKKEARWKIKEEIHFVSEPFNINTTRICQSWNNRQSLWTNKVSESKRREGHWTWWIITMGDILRKENTPLPRYFTSLYNQIFILLSLSSRLIHCSCVCVWIRKQGWLQAHEQLEPITKQQQYMMLLRCINTGRSLSNLLQKKKLEEEKKKKMRQGEGKERERRGKAWHKD